jgi:hypothetical protein
MEFIIPERGNNPLCRECRRITQTRFDNCEHPCSHLVSWACHAANSAICDAFRRGEWGESGVQSSDL